jgi:hypothetical protein
VKILATTTRWLGAYFTAVLIGYALASVGITVHNLARLSALGIDIGFGDALSTICFDFKALSPTFSTLMKYGNVVALGFLIAFPTAHALHALLARRVRAAYLDLALFALAGTTAMIAGIAIVNAQYNLSMVYGTSGVSGYLAQLLAGAVGGATFALCRRATRKSVPA